MVKRAIKPITVNDYFDYENDSFAMNRVSTNRRRMKFKKYMERYQ